MPEVLLERWCKISSIHHSTTVKFKGTLLQKESHYGRFLLSEDHCLEHLLGCRQASFAEADSSEFDLEAFFFGGLKIRPEPEALKSSKP